MFCSEKKAIKLEKKKNINASSLNNEDKEHVLDD